MKVTTHLELYEKNGSSTNLPNSSETIQINSHWNYNDRVVLNYNDGEKTFNITLIASDLIKAIHNAQNHK